jgi:MFS family permease
LAAGSPAEGSARPTWVRWRIVLLLMAFSYMQHFNRTSMAVAGDLRIREEFGLSNQQLGDVYSAFLYIYTICMTPGGWFSDRRGTWLALVVMGFGSALFCALTSLPGYGILALGLVLPAFLVIRGLMGFFSAPIYPACGRVVAHWIPFRRRSWANALVTGIAFVGIACSYVVFGQLIDWFGWRKAFLITGAVTGFLAVLWTLYATSRPSQHSSVNRAELLLIADGKQVPAPPEGVESEGLKTAVGRAPIF